MSRRLPGLALAMSFGCMLAALGGCPGHGLVASELTWSNEDALPPGTYYVQEREGYIAYFQLPQARGMAGEWLPLVESADWFSVGGFYQLSEDRVWTLAAPLSEDALDETLMLIDPLPAAE